MCDAHGRARVSPPIAENLHHQVGGAVHRLRQCVETRMDVEEAAEPHDLRHTVEIADRRLRLRDEVERAEPRRLVAGSIADPGVSLPRWTGPACRRGRTAIARKRRAGRRLGRLGRSWLPARQGGARQFPILPIFWRRGYGGSLICGRRATQILVANRLSRNRRYRRRTRPRLFRQLPLLSTLYHCISIAKSTCPKPSASSTASGPTSLVNSTTCSKVGSGAGLSSR